MIAVVVETLFLYIYNYMFYLYIYCIFLIACLSFYGVPNAVKMMMIIIMIIIIVIINSIYIASISLTVLGALQKLY